jgi:hypothetical protein
MPVGRNCGSKRGGIDHPARFVLAAATKDLNFERSTRMVKAPRKFDNMDEPLPRPDPVHDRTKHPLDPAKIEVGHIMRMSTYVRVVEVSDDRKSVTVDDLGPAGGMFTIDGEEMIRLLESADDIVATERINKTQMARTLVSTRGEPFTVAFVKKDGQERVMRGHHLKHEEWFGRSLCLDLDLLKEFNETKAKAIAAGKSGTDAEAEAHAKTGGYLRLVDHRNLVSLVVGGVQFLLS